ncbi:hypothetical protein [Aquibacillus saliphilus]|uniref:hypothetical protein n=1 Tax=Aquibacillus saliphilus TaxID=1909422 RepID=UPI001CF05113|nr:hypothetical protein [Aquibacillus saliphilus]
MKTRRTVYMSPSKDADLDNYIKQFEKRLTFSHIIKELARDGIKYRKLQKSGRIVEEYVRPESGYDKVIQSNTSKNEQDFSNVKLEKKEVKKEELENRLDEF